MAAVSPYPARILMMPPASLPPTAGHALQNFTLEPEQYHPATAPFAPVQTMYTIQTQEKHPQLHNIIIIILVHILHFLPSQLQHSHELSCKLSS